MRKLIVFMIAIILGVVSGTAAYRYTAARAHIPHSEGSDRDEFDLGF